MMKSSGVEQWLSTAGIGCTGLLATELLFDCSFFFRANMEGRAGGGANDV